MARKKLHSDQVSIFTSPLLRQQTLKEEYIVYQLLMENCNVTDQISFTKF